MKVENDLHDKIEAFEVVSRLAPSSGRVDGIHPGIYTLASGRITLAAPLPDVVICGAVRRRSSLPRRSRYFSHASKTRDRRQI
jgi:hypothetical protein